MPRNCGFDSPFFCTKKSIKQTDVSSYKLLQTKSPLFQNISIHKVGICHVHGSQWIPKNRCGNSTTMKKHNDNRKLGPKPAMFIVRLVPLGLPKWRRQKHIPEIWSSQYDQISQRFHNDWFDMSSPLMEKYAKFSWCVIFLLESIYCYDFARFISRVHLRAFFLSVISWSLKLASGLLKYLGLLQQCCFEAEKLQEIFFSRNWAQLPASSKWPFDSPNGGHLSPEKVTCGSKRGHFTLKNLVMVYCLGWGYSSNRYVIVDPRGSLPFFGITAFSIRIKRP